MFQHGHIHFEERELLFWVHKKWPISHTFNIHNLGEKCRRKNWMSHPVYGRVILLENLTSVLTLLYYVYMNRGSKIIWTNILAQIWMFNEISSKETSLWIFGKSLMMDIPCRGQAFLDMYFEHLLYEHHALIHISNKTVLILCYECHTKLFSHFSEKLRMI